MPWLPGAGTRRKRLEESADPVELTRDMWQKMGNVLTHVAALSSQVSTLTTEVTMLRYRVEGMQERPGDSG
jgi:hypothetical protein